MVRTWLFPVDQAKLLDNWNPIGLRGTASESYTVEDLFVPEEFTPRGVLRDASSTKASSMPRAIPRPTLAIPTEYRVCCGKA
jgi:hypothetical protein